jgi:hypothetical protein
VGTRWVCMHRAPAFDARWRERAGVGVTSPCRWALGDAAARSRRPGPRPSGGDGGTGAAGKGDAGRSGRARRRPHERLARVVGHRHLLPASALRSALGSVPGWPGPSLPTQPSARRQTKYTPVEARASLRDRRR